MSKGAIWAVVIYFGAFCLIVLVLNLDKVAAFVRRVWDRILGKRFIDEMRKYL